MPGYEYHDGHYHSVEDKRQRDGGIAKKTHDAWDKVLYGVGSVYYKLVGK